MANFETKTQQPALPMQQIFDFFLDPYREATMISILLEVVVFIFGILSVYYSKKRKYPRVSHGPDRHRSYGVFALQGRVLW